MAREHQPLPFRPSDFLITPLLPGIQEESVGFIQPPVTRETFVREQAHNARQRIAEKLNESSNRVNEMFSSQDVISSIEEPQEESLTSVLTDAEETKGSEAQLGQQQPDGFMNAIQQLLSGNDTNSPHVSTELPTEPVTDELPTQQMLSLLTQKTEYSLHDPLPLETPTIMVSVIPPELIEIFRSSQRGKEEK
ncbi:MAG TPA: hypothetical protein VLG12_00735 [Candidatus Saccharimonadales bacterium]|nr:hypothetical protein [Candidatus Saccharimonadales bacterium]